MKKQLKILILEDVEEDVGLICWALEKAGMKFEYKRVAKQHEFVDALRNYKPDVVLSDHSLPSFNSMEALRICRWIDLRAPFILVTGTVSEEFAVACLKQGADDYVLKSNLARLYSAIQNSLRQKELKRKQQATELELRLQNEELVKINHELDNFVYSVSHNLRAPLTTIMGLLNLAKMEDPNPSKWQNFVDMMESSIGKLDGTLREILDYSRNARNEVMREEIRFNDIVKSALSKLQYLDGFDHVEKTVLIDEKQPFYSDSYRITVIINNLLSNAIRFRDPHKHKNTVSINISTTSDFARIKIADNGEGILQEVKNKVFDMFYRGSAKSDGAGLGLYIVKEVVLKLKGSIELETEPGQGTVVTVTVPSVPETVSPNWGTKTKPNHAE